MRRSSAKLAYFLAGAGSVTVAVHCSGGEFSQSSGHPDASAGSGGINNAGSGGTGGKVGTGGTGGVATAGSGGQQGTGGSLSRGGTGGVVSGGVGGGAGTGTGGAGFGGLASGGAGMGGAAYGGAGAGGTLTGGAGSGGAGTGGSGTGGNGGKCAMSGQSCDLIPCCQPLKCCSGFMIAAPIGGATGTSICQSFCPVSDRNLKEGFESVDPNDLLERVSRLPISTWSYKFESPNVRHIGPMAQDFMATFDVGSSDRTILQVDADGVALASIQALHARLERIESENKELRSSIEALRAEVGRLQAQCGPAGN